MAKIGSILQETRLSKGLTLDSIAEETNISARFLFKLENDDHTGFPGEPYIIGFIRNYAEYLGLDAEALVARYRSRDIPPEPMQIDGADNAGIAPASDAKPTGTSQQAAPDEKGEESGISEKSGTPGPSRKRRRPQGAPAPQEGTELSRDTPKQTDKTEAPLPRSALSETQPSYRGPSLPPLRTIVVGSLGILIIGVAIVWIIAGGRLKGNLVDKNEGPVSTEYKVEGGDFQKRLYPGDSLLIPFAEDVYRISLGNIGEAVILETPFGTKELRLGESAELDPDADEVPDILVVVNDFQKDRPASGALLRVSFSDQVVAETEGSGEVTIPREAAVPPPGNTRDTVILRSTRGPYPFIVQVSFRGNCLFRYEADRKEWVEKYYTKGESININVTNALTLWSSNAQAVKLTVQASGGRSVDMEIGAPGEIAVKRLAWSRADSATWTLISSELD
mgnify:FL=1